MANEILNEQLASLEKGYIERFIPKSARWRLASILLSLITTVAVPILLFIAYMNDHNFFSYDFFIEGVFGMKIFFVTTILLLLVGTISVWVVPFVFLGRKNEIIASKIWRENKYFIVIMLFVSILMWLVIVLNFYKIFSAEEIDTIKLANLFFGLTIMFFLGIHLLTFLFSAKHQVLSSVVLLTLTIISVLIIPKQVSLQINSGLKAFGVGGNIPITIKVTNSDKVLHGKLKLITPKNIYYSPEENNDVTATYPIANIYYEVHNK